MFSLVDIKSSTNENKCSCGTAYCSDSGSVFDNNQGVTSGSNGSNSSK